MMLVVDNREPIELQSIADKIDHMQYGDIKIITLDKTFTIERKTISDFVASVHSGRLNEQLVGCDALLIHHKYGEFKYISEKRFYDMLNGVNKHHIVFHAYNMEHIIELIRRYEKQIEENKFGLFRKVVVKEELTTPVRVLGQFPGIGQDKARMLLKQHKNLNNVFNAAYNMHFTDGIGEITLNKIIDTLEEEYNE
jgi:ERCC4-type nuclease